MNVSAAPHEWRALPRPSRRGVRGAPVAATGPRRQAGLAAVDVPQPAPDTVPTPPPVPDLDDPTVPPEVVEPPPLPGEHEPVGDPRSQDVPPSRVLRA